MQTDPTARPAVTSDDGVRGNAGLSSFFDPSKGLREESFQWSSIDGSCMQKKLIPSFKSFQLKLVGKNCCAGLSRRGPYDE